ncbi:hypothetical protein HXP44_31380 [Streptomyces sioyaensis]|uniref:hypothetical protein n=1 Tax=Streptomyces sioyaensis TaxID=67364 RepID=UPI00100F5AC0|nr:hypothetical protein [Streptomyces sioyaensis]MBM4796416.1 hypothetical protein [Streptomyces sioyaensis]
MNRERVFSVIAGAAILGVLGSGVASAAPKDGASNGDVSIKAITALKHVKRAGEVCGTDVIDKETGRGKTTLVMNVKKGVASQVSAQMEISKGAISAGVGYDVTKSIEVAKETRFEVPKGKFGTIEAYVQYALYRGDIYTNNGMGVDPKFPTGKMATVMKPIGVCFNEWAK